MRGELVQNFNTLPESRIFISTDAGSTGLNLQVASIIINLDLPWNPAVLEQRIARIYRLGQQNPIQILTNLSTIRHSEVVIKSNGSCGLFYKKYCYSERKLAHLKEIIRVFARENVSLEYEYPQIWQTKYNP